jgi:hypothetical protein
MINSFEDALFKDIFSKNSASSGNLIKASEAQIKGATKIVCEDDDLDGVKIFLKKDASDSIKEIKFVCSCGQTKSIILDYSE